MTHDRNTIASFTSSRSSTVVHAPLWRDLRLLNAILAIAVIGFFVGYLFMNNQTAEKGFAVRSLETRISDLQEQSQKLNLSVVSDESMGTLQGETSTLGLVPVTTVDYVSSGSGAVAVR